MNREVHRHQHCANRAFPAASPSSPGIPFSLETNVFFLHQQTLKSARGAVGTKQLIAALREGHGWLPSNV
jgi:hypothetical protein